MEMLAKHDAEVVLSPEQACGAMEEHREQWLFLVFVWLQSGNE
jgi:hypothetical protein